MCISPRTWNQLYQGQLSRAATSHPKNRWSLFLKPSSRYRRARFIWSGSLLNLGIRLNTRHNPSSLRMFKSLMHSDLLVKTSLLKHPFHPLPLLFPRAIPRDSLVASGISFISVGLRKLPSRIRPMLLIPT